MVHSAGIGSGLNQEDCGGRILFRGPVVQSGIAQAIALADIRAGLNAFCDQIGIIELREGARTPVFAAGRVCGSALIVSRFGVGPQF